MDESNDQQNSVDEVGLRPESGRSRSVPELGFSRSTSGLSTADTNPPDRSGTDSTTEYLMTAKEIQELDQRVEETFARLQKQRDDYEKWENDLNKRRLVAYGRLKALAKFHQQRMELYDSVKTYLRDMSVATRGRIETLKEQQRNDDYDLGAK